MRVLACLAALAFVAGTAPPAAAKIVKFVGVRTEAIKTDGATIYVRVGGKGPAVVMLHGFGDTGDMWAPLAARLVADHTVVIPDLRGMGLSSHPESGYDKKSEAHDIVARARDEVSRARDIVRLLDEALDHEPTRDRITLAMRDYERDVLVEVTWRPPPSP